MPTDAPPDARHPEIEDVLLGDALGQRYLAYALSTIVSRSLPDVRDGLKPVHRRLLYAMRALGLDPNAGYKKCARVVGDVIGKFHPHGDTAVYDTLVRLAQDFAVRYPLVDGQGNFGNVDGDNPAAMRYTEARLTTVADLLLDGIDEDAVDFRATYDGEDEEPVVLPAGFPNLLANGATGIAVGMATSIPPHNAAEVCHALCHLIDTPDASIVDLLTVMPGPDFPTGGILVEPAASIREAYATGRGGFRLRARWEVEKLSRGTWQIVVTDVPYQVQKSRLVEKIADLVTSRKLALLADVRDESAEDVRLVLEPKSRTVAPDHIMEPLFRLTDLEIRIPLNMNVLDGGIEPKVMDLKGVLQAFLDHRHEVLIRRSCHRLNKIQRRLEILRGFLIVYLNLDEVIRIVREEDEPKQALIATFELTEVQATAVLDMRLRQLRKLEELEIRKEHKALTREARDLNVLLADESKRWRAISAQLREVARQFGPETVLGRRRTTFGQAPAVTDVPVAALVEREPVTVICSEKGWIRCAKGHLSDPGEIRYKEGDAGRFVVAAESTDKLLVFTSDGRFYTLGCDRLPGSRGQGEPLRLMIDLADEAEVIAMLVYAPESRLLVATASGRGFVVEADAVVAQTRGGKQVLGVDDGDRASACVFVSPDADHVAVVGTNRKMLVFPLADVPAMARGKGVILQRYTSGNLSDITTLVLTNGLRWKAGGGQRLEADLSLWRGRRAGSGAKVPRGFPASTKFEPPVA